ncbi:MAG: PD40 domain-containing protein [Chloroflexi bacterium]|nr:PD40 domain-containing protein [Chloroflexota bacterium]
MAHDNLVGQVLGQYELRELLGVGGMGAVYRGFQISLKREVAVKVLPSSLVNEPGYVERFNREAQTAALLEHPHIVSIFDYGTQQGTSYLVMRLLTGGTLAQRLNQRNDAGQIVLPSLGETAVLVSQLGSALAYAHNQGVIHRDIKTSNVMFDNQGNGYLVDFGIAKLMGIQSGLTGTGMAMGTPAYMPPEQWAGKELTPAADQYALAVLVYAMITGRVPFEAATPYELLHKHLHEQPTPPHSFRSDLPQAVDLVLARALSKEPEDRFASVTAFTIAFDSAIEGAKGESTAFFTSKIPTRHLRPVGFNATPSVLATPNLTPSKLSGGGTGGKSSASAPAASQPIAITQPTPVYKNPIAYGVLIVIILLAVILAVLLGNNRGAVVVADATATAGGGLQIISSATATETATEGSAATPTDIPPTATDTPAPPTATNTQPALDVNLAISSLRYNSADSTIVLNYSDTGSDEIGGYSVELISAASNLVFAEIEFSPSADNRVIIDVAGIPPGDYVAALTVVDGGGQIVDNARLAVNIPVAPPTATNTDIPTATPTETISATTEPTESGLMATDAVVTSNNPDETPTATDTEEATATDTPSETPSATVSSTPTATSTATEEPTATDTATETPSTTPSATATETPSPTVTASTTPSPSATHTDEPTATDTATETPSATPTDTATATPSATPTDTETPTITPSPAPDFDALEIAFHSRARSGTPQIYLMDRTGAEIVQLTFGVFGSTDPSWSPDGQRIAYINTTGGNANVWVMNRDGSDPVQLTDTPAVESSPSWSPDGQYIAYTADPADGTGSDIYVIRPEGSEPVRLTSTRGFDADPAWSPDGQSIVFATSRNGNSDIALMDFDGGNQRVLTTSAGPDFQPDWFPSGTEIVYQGYTTGFDLFSVTIDGAITQQLTKDPEFEEAYPAVSPDGSLIMFESLRVAGNPFYDLWLFDFNSGTIVQITNNTDDSSVSWRRDPALMASVVPLPEIVAQAEQPTATLAPSATPSTVPTPVTVGVTPTATTAAITSTVFMAIGTRPVLVYDSPSTQASALNVTGARVPVLGITSDGQWYKIEIREREGWVRRESTGYRIEGNVNSLPIATSEVETDEPLTGDPGFLQVMAQSEFDTELDFIASEGWELQRLGDDQALCSTADETDALLTFGASDWESYEVSVEFQYRSVQRGNFTIITRMSSDGSGIRHRVDGINSTVSQFTLRANGQSLGMGQYGVNVRPSQWAVLRAEVDGEKIRTFFDGLQISEYELLGSTYSNGFIGLEASAGTIVCLNRIAVRSLYRTNDALNNSVPVGDVLTSANLRLFDGAGFSRVGAASSGQEVFVISENATKDWFYVRVDRSRNPFEGWVTADAISVRDP